MSKFIATLFVFSFASHALAASPPNYSILQGATSDSVTHFTITARRADTLTFTAVRGGETRVPSKIERVEFPGSDWTVYRLKFEGLDLNGQYTLDVRKNGEPIDER